jgi:hypothetical protein
MSPISDSSRDGGWIAALAAALEDDESASSVGTDFHCAWGVAEVVVDDT